MKEGAWILGKCITRIHPSFCSFLRLAEGVVAMGNNIAANPKVALGCIA